MSRSMSSSSLSRPSQDFCPHCDVNVARKTYLAHKRTYFDSETGNWIKKKKISKSGMPHTCPVMPQPILGCA